MKILVTGVNGQLGFDVCRELTANNIENKGIGRNDLDVTDKKAVIEYIKCYKPTHIIHCAAYTAVDKAEDEKEICFDVNVNGTKYIAQAAKEIDAVLIYISTDYVFDGKGENYYKVDDATSPVNYYGYTKEQGEKIILENLKKYFILRTSWVFGINGSNFIKTMLKLSETRNELNIINDQIGSPTYTYDLAKLIKDMVQSDKYGIYHATNEGLCSWAEFAEHIFKTAGKDIKINKITTEEYPTKAVRPKNSRLDKSCLDNNGFTRLPAWKDAVERYIEEIR